MLWHSKIKEVETEQGNVELKQDQISPEETLNLVDPVWNLELKIELSGTHSTWVEILPIFALWGAHSLFL